jgi:hypothetical protein
MQASVRGRWHDSAFVRAFPEEYRPTLNIALVREAHGGHFEAEWCDEYGNTRVMCRSEEFEVHTNEAGLIATDEARAAHAAVLHDLAIAGWAPTGAAPLEWFAETLTAGPRVDEQTLSA